MACSCRSIIKTLSEENKKLDEKEGFEKRRSWWWFVLVGKGAAAGEDGFRVRRCKVALDFLK